MSRPAHLAVAAFSVALAVAAAACSDSPTAPAPAAPQAAGAPNANLSIFPSYATVRISGPRGVLIGGTVVFERADVASSAITITDNQPGDLDPAVGVVRAALIWDSGKVRATAKMAAPLSSRFSVVKTLVAGQNDLGTIKPHYMHFFDVTVKRKDGGAPIGGAGIRVNDWTPSRALLTHVLDNGPGDHNPEPGRIGAYVDYAGSVKVTEDPIPSGYQPVFMSSFSTTTAYQPGTSYVMPVTWAH